jgi:outer membrane protein OmpA-like peptidoglycan-associated protein
VRAFSAGAALILVAAGSAAAQDLTEEQMAERFRLQLETFRAAREDPQLGASRGLVLTPVAPAAEAGPGATVAAVPVPEPATQASEAEVGLLANYTLPKDQQVNVQVKFGFDSAALDDSARTTLRRVCGVLDAEGINVLRIVGHTDATGEAAYNQRLSVLRAEEVRRFFVNDCGIDAARLEAVGVGEQFPFDAADPFAGDNRRVEFQAMS